MKNWEDGGIPELKQWSRTGVAAATIQRARYRLGCIS